MKSILYVGATLMIGASIYGFVDYQKTSRTKEFKKMYNDKTITEPVVTNNKTAVVKSDPVLVNGKKTEVTTDVVTTEKPIVVKKKKVFRFSEFSRAPLDDKYLKKEMSKGLLSEKLPVADTVVEKKDNN